ncbi:helix-turn-helix domain-containing protein [Streptomyces virginiae]|uniref:helix-turn-helix domain-containing protein n=1 Tax=Streptomyces virginiae TaxID=1961 RepID=UPI00364B3502
MTAGESARQLAGRPGRSPSTVSREIARNSGRDRYRAASADEAACTCGRQPKLAQKPALRSSSAQPLQGHRRAP